MTVVARADLTIRAETDEDIDAIYRVLSSLDDLHFQVFISTTETSRELE